MGFFYACWLFDQRAFPIVTVGLVGMPDNLAKIGVLDRGFLIDPGGISPCLECLLFALVPEYDLLLGTQWASRDLRAPLGRLARCCRKANLGDDLCWLMRIISEGPGGFTTTPTTCPPSIQARTLTWILLGAIAFVFSVLFSIYPGSPDW